MTDHWTNAALILVAHGSHRHATAAQLVRGHAAAIRAQKQFAEVKAAFWHGSPELSEVLATVKQDTVFVVPVFKSDGHFTRVVIPREMGLSGGTTSRPDANGPSTVHLCQPVGSHPGIPKLVKGLAADACANLGISARDASVLIIGHGGRASSGSELATERVAVALAESESFGSAQAIYLEQEPLLDDWEQTVSLANVVAVPFLIGGGGHENEMFARMGKNGDGHLVITRPVGELSNISRMIVDQVAAHPASRISTDSDDN